MKNLIKLILVLQVLLLIGCETLQPMKGDRDYKTVSITWHRVPVTSIGEVCSRVAKVVYHDSQPVACAEYGWDAKSNPTCTIWEAVPVGTGGIETFGHETLHCFLGGWHP